MDRKKIISILSTVLAVAATIVEMIETVQKRDK